MKKHKKLIIALVLLLCMIPDIAYAYNLLSGYYPFSSTTNPYYYEQQGVPDHSSQILTSVARWNTVTSLYTYKTTSYGGANIYFYSDNYGNTSWVAQCQYPNFWIRDAAYIDINDYHCLPSTNYTLNAILHELGHAYGLAHNDNTLSLMYPYVQTTVLYPSSDDISGVNSIY